MKNNPGREGEKDKGVFGRLSDLNICSVHHGKYVHLSAPNWTHKRSAQEAEDHLYVSGGWGGVGGAHQDRKKGEEEGWEGRRVSKPATGRLTIALGIWEGGMQLPLCDWLTDGSKKESLS